MRLTMPALSVLLALNAFPQTSASKLWSELAQKRATRSARLEFAATKTLERVSGSFATRWTVTIEAAGDRWRESAEGRTTLFDGADVFTMEDGGTEFLHEKRLSREAVPLPPMCREAEVQWSKLEETQRRTCRIEGLDRQCVLLEASLKPWIRGAPGRQTTMLDGRAQMLLDIESGFLVALRTSELLKDSREKFQRIVSYRLQGFSSEAAGPQAFQLPHGLRLVKSFSPWRAARIVKALAGKPAPEMNAVDLHGEKVTLAALEGKIVLLDFWATWCPPCRDDLPALEKLDQKYGGRDLAIIGVSVGEGRDAVERFFGSRPHAYPNVMANENELPLPYHVEALPTYVVVGRDGTVVAAVEGDQGFSELRHILKKAGLDVD